MNIPLTAVGVVIDFDAELATDVHGYAIESDGAIYIPVIAANRPGNGDISRFLDNLPTDKVIKFPCVVSDRLLGMLKRRGFVLTYEDGGLGPVDVWVKQPSRPNDVAEPAK